MKTKNAFLLLGSLFVLLLAQGCTSAAKDIYFRSRLPTQEQPLYAQPGHSWGVELDYETRRFVYNPTTNLVKNYNLDNRSLEFDEQGLDLGLRYNAQPDWGIVKLAGSFDFLKIQFNPGRLVGIPEKWLVNVNAGIYQTAATTEKGSNRYLITGHASRESAELEENKIRTDQSGYEKKLGVMVGYWFNEKFLGLISLQEMTYHVKAEVLKEGAPALYLNETYSGLGYGLGLHAKVSEYATVGISADQVEMRVMGVKKTEIVQGLRFSVVF